MLAENTPDNNAKDIAIAQYLDFNRYSHRLQLAEGEIKRWICPVCEGNNLTTSEDGVYTCWSDESSSHRWEIRKALLKLAGEWKDHDPVQKSTKPKVTVTPKHPQAIAISSTNIKLARLPECPPITESKSLPDSTSKGGLLQTDRRETTYIYSDTQRIVRTDFICNGEKDKEFRYEHLKGGRWDRSKGSDHWHAYGSQDAIDQCPVTVESSNAVLMVEGEKSVDHIRHHLGLVTVSLRSWNKEHIEKFAEMLDRTRVTTIVFPYDHDPTGFKHATLMSEVLQNRYNVIMLDLTKLVPELPVKGDMVEAIMYGREQGWSQEEFIHRLEQEIHAAVTLKIKEEEAEKKAVETKRQKLINQDKEYYVSTTVDETVLTSLFENARGDWATMNSSYYHYNNSRGCWEIQSNEKVKNITAQHLRSLFRLDEEGEPKYNIATHANTESSFKYCRAALYREEKNNDHLIAFGNGTVNVNDMTLHPHHRDNQLIYNIDADYIPNAECPEDFKQFIYASYGEELLELMQAIISMYLDPSSPAGYFVHLIGKSGSGKGVLQRFLISMFGEASANTANKFSDLAEKEARHQILSGKRFLVFPDMGGFQKGLESFYELVDNGSLSGRALFTDTAYLKKWNCKFMVGSVDPLTVENAKDGWERRVIPIPTKDRVGEADHTLGQRLDKCKAQVISWALHMDRERRNYLIKNAATILKSVQDLKHQQVLFSDPLRAFVDSCLRPHSGTLVQLNTEIREKTRGTDPVIPTTDLFKAYQAYCKVAGSSPVGFPKFVNNIKSVLPIELFRDRSKETSSPGKRINTPAGYKIAYAFGAIIPCGNGEFSTEPKCNLENCHEGGLNEIKDYVAGRIKNLETEARAPLDQENITESVDETPRIDLPEIGDWVTLMPYNAIEGIYESPEEVFVTLVDSDSSTFFYAKRDAKVDKNHNDGDWAKVPPNICVEEGLVRGIHPHFKREGNGYVKK